MKKQKEFEYFSCKLDKKIAAKLGEITANTGLAKTTAVERAVEYYYQRYKETGKI